jgi:hypothetical protein
MVQRELGAAAIPGSVLGSAIRLPMGSIGPGARRESAGKTLTNNSSPSVLRCRIPQFWGKY